MRGSLTVVVVILFAGLLSNADGVENRADLALTLREKAVVSGPEIRLGDLADLAAAVDGMSADLAGLSIGPSPMPGETRIVTRTEVGRILEAADLSGIAIAGAPSIRISRSSRSLTQVEVAQVLKSHIASVTAWEPDEIEVRSIRNLKDVLVPEGNTALRFILKSPPSSFRNLLLPLEVSVDGRSARTVYITADVRINAAVMQAARMLPFGTALTGDDIRQARIEITDPRAAYVRKAEAATGKILRRSIKIGELITEDALSDPLVVRSGDTVRLRLEQQNIRLVILARAEQDGRVGQSIRVRNLEFARVMKALVVGPGEVLIQ
jgi:flagellar basal body P-ring formation protein FlgA